MNFFGLKHRINKLFGGFSRTSAVFKRQYYETLRNESRNKTALRLSGYGYKVYSQSDEDGIIAEIFRRIGFTNKYFVEIGVGDGLENNTAALLQCGWRGLWIEASENYFNKINEGMSRLIKNGQLILVNEFATPENIDKLISLGGEKGEIDLLSLDIDGEDAHVLENITVVSPRVLVIEYNAKFGPSIRFCMDRRTKNSWGDVKSDNFGASLKYFEEMLHKKGYKLVGCNIAGTNAFFVRSDLVAENFEAPHTSEHHFEPARYELTDLPSGHPSSYKSFDFVDFSK